MLVEINPLIVTPEGEVRALDSKFTVDDNALYAAPRHRRDARRRAADPQEQMAREKGLTYVKLDGEVGILGNGAGLVMSTLDVVAQAGGRAANFLDVGGGAQAQGIVDALGVITSDSKVRAILFNIFGGITRCDEVAQGILDALDGRDIGVPIVVRLDGTSDEESKTNGAKREQEQANCRSPIRRAGRSPIRVRNSLSVLECDETCAPATIEFGESYGLYQRTVYDSTENKRVPGGTCRTMRPATRSSPCWCKSCGSRRTGPMGLR